MANYTIELYKINNAEHDSKYTNNIFTFDYDFYLPSHKEKFEQLFIDKYSYDEIGFESIGRFKHELKAFLNLRYKHYKELYETELKCQEMNINFMYNKDLVEEFDSSSNSNSSTTGSSNSLNKNLDTPQNKIENLLNNKYLSSASQDENSSDTTSSDANNQKTKLKSQGNIGVSSSATLLDKWRKTLQSVDELIIRDTKFLFMQYSK